MVVTFLVYIYRILFGNPKKGTTLEPLHPLKEPLKGTLGSQLFAQSPWSLWAIWSQAAALELLQPALRLRRNASAFRVLGF